MALLPKALSRAYRRQASTVTAHDMDRILGNRRFAAGRSAWKLGKKAVSDKLPKADPHGSSRTDSPTPQWKASKGKDKSREDTVSTGRLAERRKDSVGHGSREKAGPKGRDMNVQANLPGRELFSSARQGSLPERAAKDRLNAEGNSDQAAPDRFNGAAAPMQDNRFNGAASQGLAGRYSKDVRDTASERQPFAYHRREPSLPRSGARQHQQGDLAERASEAGGTRRKDREWSPAADQPHHRSTKQAWQRESNQRGGSRYGTPEALPAWRVQDPQASFRRGPGSQNPTQMGYQSREREPDPLLKGVRDSWQGDALYGVNPVAAAFTAQRRQLYTLYCQEGSGTGKQGSQIRQIQKMAETAGVSCRSLSKHNLNVLTDNAAHQGLVLDCEPLSFETLDDFGAAPLSTRPVWIALDEITDPHNMGAIIRSATVLGATGILTCARNSSPLSPAVSKVSAGAIEHFPVFSCHAMQKTLAKAATAGWRVLGATIKSSGAPCHTFVLDQPTILVLGSEGTGLRTNVEMACTELIKIDTGCSVLPEALDSLNVSVAAGILVHQFLTSSKKSAV